MAFGDTAKRIKTKGFGATTSGGFGGNKINLQTPEGLLQTATKAGLGKQAQKILTPPKKLSALERLSAGLSAFNPAEALLTGIEQKSVGAGIAKYATGFGTSIGEAISGRDIDEQERRTFADVAEKTGIHNAILKGGIGFLGDVLLDPSTYFGGAIAKGIGGVVKAGAKAVIPKVAREGISEAAGRAFQFGFGTTKGLPEKALEIQSKLSKAKEGIVASNIARLGTGTLSRSQQEELVQKLLAGKRAEFGAKIGSSLEKDLSPFAVEAKKITPEAKNLLSESIKSDKTLVSDKIISDAEKFAKFGGNEKIDQVQILESIDFNKLKKLPPKESQYYKYLEGAGVLDKAIGKTSGKILAREVAQSTDPLVQKTIGEQTIRSQKFAQQAGVADPYEIYFPGIKKDSIGKFVEGTKQLKVGSEGYLKQFKNLLTDDELIKNPAEAFARREFDVAKDNIVRSQLRQVVEQYGKPITSFKSSDEALKAGYKVVKEKGIFGKEIGYLKDVDKKFLDNLISPEFTSIDMIAKATGFDALTSLFKRSVTGLFPSFHVRNFVSGHIQNFEVLGIRALNPVTISMGQKMAYRLAKNDKTLFKGTFGNEMKAFADRFGTSSQYIADIADATKGAGIIPGKILSAQSIKETLKTLGLGQQSIPFRVARAIGNFIETQQKSIAYLTALGQGKTIKEALDLATRAGFDYRALTGFESKIMRRIIPFYSFTRKNIELQLRTLGENPQRINQVLRLADNIAGDISKEEREGLPDYMKEQIAIKTGISKTGLPEFAAGFGTPVEAFTGLFGSTFLFDKDFIRKNLSSMNNLIKLPLERAVGRDFFRNRPLNEVVEANEYKNMPQFVKNFLQLQEVKSVNKEGKEKIKYNANPMRLQLLRSLPTSRGVSYLGQIFNEDTTETTKALYGLTGIKARPIDLETVEYFRQRDQQKALEELLIRSGIIKTFERAYIPKEQKKGGFNR